MRVRYALMAEYANVTGDGKLNVMGVLDRLFAYHFPATHRELVVVNSLEIDNEDDGTTQQIEIRVIDPEAHSMAQVGGQLNVVGGKQVFNQIHVFQDLEFQGPGLYQVLVMINGVTVSTLDLELVQIPEPPGAAPNGPEHLG